VNARSAKAQSAGRPAELVECMALLTCIPAQHDDHRRPLTISRPIS
jgi:hypothetical protein